MLRTYNLEEIYQGRLKTGDDLLLTLTKIANRQQINSGKVTAIGAVKKAVISYYDQEEQVYNQQELDQPLEIINLSGNLSLKDGEPIVHAHIALGAEDGRMYGGHLEKGTTVFACEFTIEEYAGQAWERGLDSQTGLPLWQEK